MQTKDQGVHLVLTQPQYLVLHELLMNIKLGDRNQFESEISDLVIALENDVGDFAVANMQMQFGKPGISLECDDYGFTINID